MKSMNTINGWMLAAAVALVSTLGATTMADVLDEGLGGDAPKKEAVQPAGPPAPKPEVKLTRPKMPDLVSPEAAKTVDDQDLMNKLTGKADVAGGEAKGAEEKMNEVMERMGQAETRLAQQQDPGLITQETQRRIVTDLDVMIEYLKEQEKKGGGQGKGKPKDGQERQKSKGQQQGSQPGQGMGGSQAAQDSQMRPGSAQTPQANSTDLHEAGRNWGNLPERERDLVAHGAKEHYLPEYKEMINKYYQALAEIGRASRGR
jgi:hypothetical protein